MNRYCVIVLLSILFSVGLSIDSLLGVPDNEKRRYEQPVRLATACDK